MVCKCVWPVSVLCFCDGETLGPQAEVRMMVTHSWLSGRLMRTESWGVILRLDLSVYAYVGFHLTKYPFRDGPSGEYAS